MKILVMAPFWGQFGGKEEYLLSCIREFTHMGHRCSLAYGRLTSRPVQSALLSCSQRQISTFSEIAGPADQAGVDELVRLLRDEQPDVIFMTDVKNMRLLTVLKEYGGLVPMSHDYWLTCPRLTRTTYLRQTICTHTSVHRCLPHGCFLQRGSDDQSLKYRDLFEHRAILNIYKELDIHLVASEYVKETLVRHGFDANRVKVVGYFTDLNVPSDPTHREDGQVVLFVGQVTKVKGVDYLIRALAHVSVPFKLFVIGDGEYLARCKELSSTMGIADRVTFTGWLSRERLTEHLTASSLLVVPSIWPEPFGIVGLEAMTCSKPVVAFDSGGISEWLKDGANGYLVPIKRIDLLAHRIESLLRDQQRARDMGIEGFRRVAHCFSKATHFEKLLSAFEWASRRRHGQISQEMQFRIV